MKPIFLPINQNDLKQRGWDQLDIILISGDAYVDHPSYGVALIGRFLESHGFKVGIIPQPDWRQKKDFLGLGKPRLFFGISSGNVDSMIANYTVNKKPRKNDDYSPGSRPGMRPDRAVIVYANRIKEAFPGVPIVLGGIEASLRRLDHYDYWDDSLRRSILLDSKADILAYGMAEKAVLEIAQRLNQGEDIHSLNNIRGTVLVRKNNDFLTEYLRLPEFKEVKENKKKFAQAFKLAYSQADPLQAKALLQQCQDRLLIQFPPALPLSSQELDRIYALPFTRAWHPSYDSCGGIKGFETVRFSITTHRGCCGECSFCALYFHQGKIVQSRSQSSILQEARLISGQKEFKGTITDIGGPTANLYQARCQNWGTSQSCLGKHCLMPAKCANLRLGYRESIRLYRNLRKLPGVKNVFISSGLRYDLLNSSYADEYLREICKFHISGQIKVAPEHSVDKVLQVMNKPAFSVYENFVEKFKRTCKQLNKNLFIVNYFITAHPACSIKDALELALYLLKHNIRPQQIQDFLPSPMSLSTCIYYTGLDPLTGEKITVPRTFRERKIQRALIQYANPKNKKLIIQTLNNLQASHLLSKFFRSYNR